MKFYFINDADLSPGEGPYFTTLDVAKRKAREVAKNSYDDISVEVVDVATDKENVLRLLNVDTGTHESQGVVYTAKAGKK